MLRRVIYMINMFKISKTSRNDCHLDAYSCPFFLFIEKIPVKTSHPLPVTALVVLAHNYLLLRFVALQETHIKRFELLHDQLATQEHLSQRCQYKETNKTEI
jgi:hypothetical protein